MRSFGANDLVALPRLSASGAVALGQALLTVAKGKTHLPELIGQRLVALEAAHTALCDALGNQAQVLPDPQRARNADLATDQTWSAFHDWLIGWGKLRGPEAESARTMYSVLFPTKLKFTRLAYRLEWAEAEARLGRIAKEGFDRKIEQMGGSVFLEQLKAAHRAYGEALGITAEGQDAAAAGLREPLDRFLSKLRAYVLAVAAYADDPDEVSVAFTDALLIPLRQWKSTLCEATVEEPAEVIAAPAASAVTASPGAVKADIG
jgi:hypothetical protein